MTVQEIMNKQVISVSPEDSAASAARLLARYNIGSVPVCTKDGQLKGIVTDRDIVLRCVAADSDPNQTPIREIMSRSIVTAAPEDDVTGVSRQMAQSQIRRLPVVGQGGKVVGMVSLGDLAKCSACNVEAGQALTDISHNLRRR